MIRTVSSSGWRLGRMPWWGSDRPVIYLDVIGKRCGYTLSIVGDEHSVSVRDCDTDETITTVKGREGALRLRWLLGEIKTKLWEDK